MTSSISTISSNIQNITNQINSVQNQLVSNKKELIGGELNLANQLSTRIGLQTPMLSNIAATKNALSLGTTGLTSLASIVNQMQALATQAASPTTLAADLTAMGTTFSALATQINNIGNASGYGNLNVLAPASGASSSVTLAIGLDSSNASVKTTLTLGSFTASGLATSASTMSISSAANALTTLTSLATWLSSITLAQSTLSQDMNLLDINTNQLSSMISTTQTALDNLQKVDATALQTQLQDLNNQQSINYYLITQMNQESAAKLVVFR